MLHVLIDSCIYRADRKRSKPAFRAVTRLARKNILQIHIPAFVKGEVLSQLQHGVRAEIDILKSAANRIVRITAEETLISFADNVLTSAAGVLERADALLANEFETWMTNAKEATEHHVQPDHGARVAAAYFAGTPPFRAPKHREDLPDSCIWESALDLAQQHGEIVLVSTDGRLRLGQPTSTMP